MLVRLCLLFVLFAAPAFAAPQVLDLTKEDEAPIKPDELIAHGTIHAACAPWKSGLSVAVDLDNHVGLTMYLSIESLEDKINMDFKAGGETMQAGDAVIFRCDDKDANCNQVSGTVTFTHIKDPEYAGRYHIEGEDPKHFDVKRVPSTAKCEE